MTSDNPEGRLPTIDPVALATALIRCPSVTPNAEQALDLLQNVLQQLGFSCRRMPFSDPGGSPRVDNLYARRGNSGRNLCFAGHLDVVPPGDEQAWRRPPFSGDIIDGRLYGRGAADMKGAVACWTAAVAQTIAAGVPGNGGSVSLLITGDEEGPGVNGTRKMLQALTAAGEKLDACITGEPTNPERLGDMIKIGRRGSLNAMLTVYGRQGHTGYPQLADNAAQRMVRILNALLDWKIDSGTEHFQPSTLAVSSIDVDNPATNVIPERAAAAFNIRFNDLHDGQGLETRLRGLIDNAAGADARYRLDVTVTGEAFLTPPGKLSELVCDAARAVTGRRPALSTEGGTSDSRFIKDYCPVLDFGLVGRSMHQTDEHADIADIRDLTEIYRRVIMGYFAA